MIDRFEALFMTNQLQTKHTLSQFVMVVGMGEGGWMRSLKGSPGHLDITCVLQAQFSCFHVLSIYFILFH